MINKVVAPITRIFKKLFSRFNFDLLFLILFTICLNLRFFISPVFDARDTTTYFKIFYSFYNEFYQNSQLINWMPFSMFGHSASFLQFNFLSFTDYFFILAGKIFDIENVYKLFILSVTAKQVVFAFGG